MMIEIVTSTKDMTKEEWLNYRNKGIGGSDVSVICGVNKYKSAVELWMEKKGYMEQPEAGESVHWGIIMEPIIRKEFSLRTGLNVDVINSMLKHPKYDFMFANVDGVVTDENNKKCIFEAKIASAYKAKEWEGDNIPQEYMLQVQHYMAVTGYEKTYIAVLIGGNKFEYKVIERDDELIDMIIKLERKFWTCVEKDVPPEIDGSEGSTKLMNILYPTASDSNTMKLPIEAEELIRQYNKNKDLEKEYAEKKDEAVNKLKNMLGDNEIGNINENIVSWKNYCSERIDSKKLKKEMPEIYEKFSRKMQSRRFAIK